MDNKYLKITDKNYEPSSYKRGIFRGDKIQDFYFYREYDVTISKKGNYIEDRYFTYLLDNELIDKDLYDQYHEQLQEYFKDIDRLDPYGIEDIYEDLLEIRSRYCKDQIITNPYKTIDGFNQEELFFELLKEKDSVIMILDDINETELFEYYKNKIDKDVYVLKPDSLSLNLEKLPYDEKLQNDIDNNRCILMVFSEAGFLVCHDLKIDSFVIGDAVSLPTRYFLNCKKGNHFIYVPAGFNIQKYIHIVRPSTLTYSQLYYLWIDKGFDIYRDIDKLNELYPEYFDNIYQYDGRMVKMPDLNKYNYQKINYEDNQGKVVMHTVKLNKPYDVKVIKNYDKKDIHGLFSDYKGTYLVCNFLFFTTFKLMKFYNFQRNDRIDEMIDYSHFGHLDYMKDDGFESIPLYNKATFIVNNENEILFRHLSKPGGCLYIDDDRYVFDESNYNCEDDRDLIIYIPSYSIGDQDSNNYVKEVGKDRFNIVMIQEHVICAKNGSVYLPCIGYVISLRNERQFKNIRFELDISKDYKLAYGGGMMLIDEGRDFVIDDFKKEGWMSALSKLSQDTSMEKLDWNPRCSLGLLKDGAFTINVFDGRNEETPGATYNQMCKVVRSVYPDIEYLLNVDGGASAFLGIVKDGVFKEISRPSTAADNISGQARDVMTLLMLRVDD